MLSTNLDSAIGELENRIQDSFTVLMRDYAIPEGVVTYYKNLIGLQLKRVKDSIYPSGPEFFLVNELPEQVDRPIYATIERIPNKEPLSVDDILGGKIACRSCNSQFKILEVGTHYFMHKVETHTTCLNCGTTYYFTDRKIA